MANRQLWLQEKKFANPATVVSARDDRLKSPSAGTERDEMTGILGPAATEIELQGAETSIGEVVSAHRELEDSLVTGNSSAIARNSLSDPAF